MWRELSEMETDDCACAPTWFTGPQNATAKAIRDRRDLIAEVERLRSSNAQMVSALEDIGGCDCVLAAARYGQPCGVCITCIARKALDQHR